jgi:hypothetical protein
MKSNPIRCLALVSQAFADGELGTGVIESELTTALARALECPKRDPEALASAVQARFGRQRFATVAYATVERVLARS